MTEPTRISGRLEVRRVALGSKSERSAVVLEAADRYWVLTRAGSRFGELDEELVALAGRRVSVTGHAGAGVFLVTAVEVDEVS